MRLIPLVLVLVAGALVATAATAAPKEQHGFRHVLAAKLGAQLDKPADDVRAALKASRPGKGAAKGERRKAWTASMAKELGVPPAAVTAAVKALVKERLDSLVEDGWLTAEQRDRRLERGNFGIRLLRVGR